MSPSRPLSDAAKKNLDRGCIGLCSVYQGLGETFPENAPGTKAYLSEAQASARVVDKGQSNFVFAKQGKWLNGRPKPDPQTGEIPVRSIRSNTYYNYVTKFPGTGSYAWMDRGIAYGPQTAKISNVPPGNDLIYQRTVWYSTPIDH